MQNYSVSQSGAVTTVNAEEGFHIFVTSDVHFDSVHCNRDQFFRDMDYAVQMDSSIWIIGDFFDAMQGRFDPRRDMSHLRPEYRREDYYDYIVKDAAAALEPYSKHLKLITRGNHELSVLKNANTDLIARLCDQLNINESVVYSGGYGGIALVKYGNTTCPIKFFHGSGGEAPVTRGAIQTNRQAVFLPDFQVVLNGHSHHTYWMPITRERVTNDGRHYFDLQHHVRTPGYHMSYGDGSGGWEVTKGGVPKPIGGAILYFMDNEVLCTPMVHAPRPISPIADSYNGIIFPQE